MMMRSRMLMHEDSHMENGWIHNLVELHDLKIPNQSVFRNLPMKNGQRTAESIRLYV